MPTQKNSASWDLQLGFNLAFKRLTEVNEHFDLSYFSFPVHGDKQCFNTSHLQSQCSSLPLWCCLSDFFHPLIINFFHLVTLTQMLACTPALTKYLLVSAFDPRPIILSLHMIFTNTCQYAFLQ